MDGTVISKSAKTSTTKLRLSARSATAVPDYPVVIPASAHGAMLSASKTAVKVEFALRRLPFSTRNGTIVLPAKSRVHQVDPQRRHLRR